MENPKQEIISKLKDVLRKMGIEGAEPQVNFPQDDKHGDYSSNIALAMFASSKFPTSPRLRGAGKIQNSKFRTPMELATHIVEKFKVPPDSIGTKFKVVERIEVAPPGFINFWLSEEFLISQMTKVLEGGKKVDLRTKTEILKPPKGISTTRVLPSSKGRHSMAAQVQNDSKRVMVEYAHPNTHKEMHIGHMRTLITGEALARLFEATGNKVFRANYQGDIGPHVAKAIFGLKKIIKDENLSLKEINKWKNINKAEILGRGYVVGNKEYEANKDEIDGINSELYELASEASLREAKGDLKEIYQITRQWSLDYYNDFYKRFYTKFDRLFFESETAACGKKIVEEHVGKVFEEDDGAIVFKKGPHTRVFVTSLGYPTYEGKEMCLGFKEYEAFPFDRNIHVVGSEQAGYFQVVFKALELLDPEKFKDTQYHLSMGMVNIIGMKISSRTGEILRVDSLIEKVKERVSGLVKEGKIKSADLEKTIEEIAIGAIKYSVLKVGTGQNVEFDIEKSVSLDGNSGPYLQYTYARTQSVLAKFKIQNSKFKITVQSSKSDGLNTEELSILRTICIFSEVIEDSARNMAPNSLTNYLFDLAQKFNLFYQRHSILGKSEEQEGTKGRDPSASSGRDVKIREFRLGLTNAVGLVLKDGLNLLGIEAPERM